jgi:phage host-nuclease inhibitor protein Gam
VITRPDPKDKEEFPGESKTLELNFGKIYFKWTPYRIEFDVEEETVIERLRARKMESCIRVVTSVNKEALEAYDDDVLKKLGCRRERDDKFHYEVKREEGKL